MQAYLYLSKHRYTVIEICTRFCHNYEVEEKEQGSAGFQEILQYLVRLPCFPAPENKDPSCAFFKFYSYNVILQMYNLLDIGLTEEEHSLVVQKASHTAEHQSTTNQAL